MSRKDTSGNRKPLIGLFLMGSLVALLVYAGVTAHPDSGPGPVAAEAGRSGPISAEQVMLSSALILGPVTALLLLEN